MYKNNLMETYNRFEVCFEKGIGSKLYSVDGKEYIDFVSGVATNCLGHSNPAIVETIQNQCSKLMHISNYYFNMPAINLSNKLCENSNHEKVFFCNTGTEAVEAALKLARKYGKNQNNPNKNKIVYMNNSFHGRTLGALAVTGQKKYQENFTPLIGNVINVDFNDLASIKSVFNDDICGVILEPIQGEGGIISADIEYLNEIKLLCDKFNALLIFDEVQCGIGRLGSLFAYEQFNVIPDVVCMAKGLGGGFPIGAIIANKKASAFVPGDHGTTFGGNPLACAVAYTVLTELIDGGIISSVKDKNKYLIDNLNILKEKYPTIQDIRGMGLLVGFSIDTDTKLFIDKCFEEGLLIISAGKNIVRLLPPLNVSFEEIDNVLTILDKVLGMSL